MKIKIKIASLVSFSIAMAYLESAIVVYLRLLYYPEGFFFPIKIIPTEVFLIELGREFATIIMLATVSFLAGRKFIERICYFLISFGVWDIFYYIWLKVFINWPDSLLTDDLLFLIPVPWISPVLAPVVVSVIFIVMSVFILKLNLQDKEIKVSLSVKLLVVSGLLIILFTFVENFQSRINMASPVDYLWGVFVLGVVMLLLGSTILILSLVKIREEK